MFREDKLVSKAVASPHHFKTTYCLFLQIIPSPDPQMHTISFCKHALVC